MPVPSERPLPARACHHGFVPPHLLHELARRGGEREREWALATLAIDATLRAARLGWAALPARPSGERTLPVPVRGVPQRVIFDARHHQDLPGRRVRAEGQPPVPDTTVDDAFDALGSVHRFWWQCFGRDSIDDAGLVLLASVHFGRAHRNAFWNGEEMVFGDGDGVVFRGFAHSVDVVGHELAHGVTQRLAGLAYFGQAGALNESLSDVFGALARQFVRGESAADADWLIGADVFGPSVGGRALRSMKAPGTAYDDPRLGRDPQPAHMRHYVRMVEDNGGVHVNSGIPNHAFYRAAVAIGGAAWERAGRIWYDTLRDARLARDAGFDAFAGLTLANARRLHGAASPEAGAVDDAWRAVGIVPLAADARRHALQA